MKQVVYGLWVMVCLLSASAQTPQMINYQGRLLNGTNLVNGSASLRFNLYTSDTAVVQIYQSTAQVAVVDGLYSARIGEFETINTLASALTNAPLWLEIVVNEVPLTPRERVTSVAYALLTDGVKAGGVTTAMLSDGAVSGPKIAAGAVSNVHIVAGTIGSRELADHIEIGATNVNGELHVFGTPSNTPSISLFGAENRISTFGSDSLEQVRIWGESWGEVLLYDSSPANNIAAVLTANGTSGGALRLSDNDGNLRAQILAARSNTAASISLYGTNTSVIAAALSGGTNAGGSLTLRGASGISRIALTSGATAAAAEISVNDTSGSKSVSISSGPTNFFLGGLGIGTNIIEAPLHVAAGSSGADPVMNDTIAVFESGADNYVTLKAPTNFMQGLVFATSISNHDAAVLYNFNNERSLRFRTAGTITRMMISTNGNVGIGTTINLTNRLTVLGNIQCTALIQTSDRNAKHNFTPVSAADVLEKVAALPISTWHYTETDSGLHLGPMAQDFHAAFGLGNTDTGIFSVDADGVALAAIQALKKENEALKKQLDEVLQRLKALEAK